MLKTVFNPLVLFLLPLIAQGEMWIERKAEGWAWYEDKEAEKEKEKKIAESHQSAYPFLEQLQNLSKALEEAKAKAIIEPSQESVYRYQQLQKIWMEKSAQFSEFWALNLLNNPELDPRIEAPSTLYGTQIAAREKTLRKKKMIEKISKRFGLLFVYNGKELSSQAFSIPLMTFAKKYSWDILSVSHDGYFIEGIHSLPDNGVTEKFGIEVFPSLYIVDLEREMAIPISHGMCSIDQIENNLMAQFEVFERESRKNKENMIQKIVNQWDERNKS